MATHITNPEQLGRLHVRPRLFEPFAREPDAAGTGLGLAISRSYARAHGGDLVYEPSETGARFELLLPQD